jgi:23S rRNA U2552 (ribose-2'-O)-methylase RlmE/FtsJ
MEYPFVVYQVPSDKDDDLQSHIKKSSDVVVSNYVCEPKLEYGFYYFIHRSKEKTRIQSDPRYQNKYHITNPFEHNVPDYDKDIQKSSEAYFSAPPNTIISRAFYKFWEVLMCFDILPESGSIKTAHLAEAPGGFIQAVSLYRNKFFKQDAAKDDYSTISIKAKEEASAKPKRFNPVPNFKTAVLKNIRRLKICDVEDCDIMKKSVQDQYVKDTGEVHLVTADGGFVWKDENYQEQEAYKLIMAEIVLALKLQKKSGCFVLKIFDTFTDLTLKMIAILRTYYKETHIFVPLMSRPSNSEKYLVCLGFQGISQKEIDNLERVLQQMTENSNEKKTAFTIDILPEYQLGKNLKAMNKSIGVYLVNEQFKSINIMISYLEKGIFFGDDYHRFREAQIKASEFWVSTFYPSDLKSARKKIQKHVVQAIQDNQTKTNELKTIVATYD